MINFKKKRTQLILLVATIAVLLLATFPPRSLLQRFKLLPVPTTYAELFFNDSAELPTTYTPGEPQVLDFTIRSLGPNTRSYTYKITQVGDGSDNERMLNSAQVTLRDAAQRVKISITPTDMGERSVIVITLDQPNTYIQLRLGRSE